MCSDCDKEAITKDRFAGQGTWFEELASCQAPETLRNTAHGVLSSDKCLLISLSFAFLRSCLPLFAFWFLELFFFRYSRFFVNRTGGIIIKQATDNHRCHVAHGSRLKCML